ncbi:hypothetical protein [Simiduia aestuariiviva]|uniref:DUF3024 domain-containing protein n=1 Tax=Simiduia aestuariiviva TaxID=1510459 RepID=A0A839UIV7_9GAMM|nr:hypothetical protein [Simiduia aestuariiviva]MBB3167483.1 hypothetical protein [Simiduia aestuariiviva]
MSQYTFPVTPQLNAISEFLSEAHARIQQNFTTINPVVGINQQMRASGIPADVITIDCLTSNRRILIILHDSTPDVARYQFGKRDRDPEKAYREIALNALTADQLYQWMGEYFSE